jgi:hypothetical protein
MSLPNTLQDIITKVRRVTARPSVNQISDAEIIKYINTFYVYDMPEHLRMESLHVNYQFTTTANIPAYDFPTGLYLTNTPPVYIGGYESYMTQSRQNFFRVNPSLNFLQQSIAIGSGINTFTATLTATPILPGFKRNPPGAYSTTEFPAPANINWNVLISTDDVPNITSGITPSVSLVDDGQGNLFATTDPDSNPVNKRGTINYITGAVNVTNFPINIPTGNAVNAQYVPYVASRPQSVIFFQDQFLVYPIPDQAYTVSFEAYQYPTAFLDTQTASTPQLSEWWQMLAYGAADKIFADNADFERMAQFRPLLQEQMDLCLRRTIVQNTSKRTATIYTEQSGVSQFPFGNLFSGF